MIDGLHGILHSRCGCSSPVIASKQSILSLGVLGMGRCLKYLEHTREGFVPLHTSLIFNFVSKIFASMPVFSGLEGLPCPPIFSCMGICLVSSVYKSCSWQEHMYVQTYIFASPFSIQNRTSGNSSCQVVGIRLIRYTYFFTINR